MSGSTFEKVFMDTNFKNCQSIYDKLSKFLEHIDIQQFGDLKEINVKILSLSSDMFKLLCVAQSVFIYNQKLKGNSVTNFIFEGIDLLENNSSKADLSNLNAITTKPVERHVECNGHNHVPSDFSPIPLQGATVKDDKKAMQASKSTNESASTTDPTPLVVTSKVRTEVHRTILYKDEKYTCNMCAVTVQNVDDVLSHVSSEEHTNLCKNPSACFDNILKDSPNLCAFWSLIPMHLKICKIYIQPTGLTCTLCKCAIPFNANGIYSHISGKKHLASVPACLQLLD